MDTDELHQSPPSPTHQAIMSMVDNYTHFESTYRNYPEAAEPVLQQVNLLRAALEAFRITVDANTGTNPFEEEKTNTDGVETPETTAHEDETENESTPHQDEVPVCKEESITIVLPLQCEYELQVPYTDKALSIGTPDLNDPSPDDERVKSVAQATSLPSIGTPDLNDPSPDDERVESVAQAASLPPIGTPDLNDPSPDDECVKSVAQEASLPSIGPSGTPGHESNPDNTDGPIALSTQEENKAL